MKEKLKETQINVRLTTDQKEKLKSISKKQKKSISQLVVDNIIEGDTNLNNIYNIPVMNSLYLLTDIVINELPKLTSDKEVIDKCREASKELWQFLK